MKRTTIIPLELIPAAIEWEQLREVYWSQLGRDTAEIRSRINGLQRRVQTESMEQN